MKSPWLCIVRGTDIAMILPDDNLRKRHRLGAVSSLLLLVLLAAAIWVAYVFSEIRRVATTDQRRHADAIAVFGAAEYDGRPSPVLRARLDHALMLYQDGYAPLLVTLGGNNAGDANSEGGVGHDYLLAHGVKESQIIAETSSRDTEESARRLAAIARENHLRTILVVSDGTHLFRIEELCRAEGLEVFGSPRAETHTLSFPAQVQRVGHEILSYTLWRLHLH
jgi:uncharacterized SAM-binding protein YcdF (DUF218 family)